MCRSRRHLIVLKLLDYDGSRIEDMPKFMFNVQRYYGSDKYTLQERYGVPCVMAASYLRHIKSIKLLKLFLVLLVRLATYQKCQSVGITLNSKIIHVFSFKVRYRQVTKRR